MWTLRDIFSNIFSADVCKWTAMNIRREGEIAWKDIIYLHQPMPFIFMNIDKVRKVEKEGSIFPLRRTHRIVLLSFHIRQIMRKGGRGRSFRFMFESLKKCVLRGSFYWTWVLVEKKTFLDGIKFRFIDRKFFGVCFLRFFSAFLSFFLPSGLNESAKRLQFFMDFAC